MFLFSRSPVGAPPTERPTEQSALPTPRVGAHVLRPNPLGNAASRVAGWIQERRDRLSSHWHAARSRAPDRRVARRSEPERLRAPRVPASWSESSRRSRWRHENGWFSRHRVKDVEPGLAHPSDAERPIEDVAACLREVDCAQDLRDRRHRYLLTDQRRRSFRVRTPFRRGDVTPSVHGGASLAGNESARIASISLSSASRSVGCSPWRFGMSWSCVTGERFTCGSLPRSGPSMKRRSDAWVLPRRRRVYGGLTSYAADPQHAVAVRLLATSDSTTLGVQTSRPVHDS